MAESEAGAGDVFDVDRIRRLIELMQEYDLAEIDLRQDDEQIRLCRGGAVVAPSAAPAAPAPVVAPVTPAESVAASEENITYIKSPIVGTFYSKPNPNAERFVKIGDHVDAETTVCVIEAMKVFNEIPAEVTGRIVAVLVQDEDPVEFGMPLFKVETGG